MNDFWRRLLELERRQLLTARGQEESASRVKQLSNQVQELSGANDDQLRYIIPVTFGTSYGIKTWVVWQDRSLLPTLANPLADDLGKQRIIAGGNFYYGSPGNNLASDHGIENAYTKIAYSGSSTFGIGQYTYAKPDSTPRSIPGIGAYDSLTAKSYFLYADSSVMSNSYGISNYAGSLSSGTLVISGVKFHYDDSHGNSIYSDVATGDIHFEWPYARPATDLHMRLSSAFPAGTFGGGYTAAELETFWNLMQTWVPCSTPDDPVYSARYKSNQPVGSNGFTDRICQVQLDTPPYVYHGATQKYDGHGAYPLIGIASAYIGPRISSVYSHSGGWFPGCGLSGNFEASAYLQVTGPPISGTIYGGNATIEFKWTY